MRINDDELSLCVRAFKLLHIVIYCKLGRKNIMREAVEIRSQDPEMNSYNNYKLTVI